MRLTISPEQLLGKAPSCNHELQHWLRLLERQIHGLTEACGVCFCVCVCVCVCVCASACVYVCMYACVNSHHPPCYAAVVGTRVHYRL